MKSKNESSLVVNIFLVVVVVVLVGLLIAWMTGVFKDKRQDLNNGTEKIDHVIGTISEFDLVVYDGYTMKGSSLVELINEYTTKEAPVAIGVQTLANMKGTSNKTTYYNYSITSDSSGYNLGTKKSDTVPTVKTSDDYIAPNESFKGEILRNSNNDIIGILFVQQK